MPLVTPATAVTQSSLTLVAEFDEPALASVKATLERLGDDPEAADGINFSQLQGVHFARLLLLEPATDLDGEPLAGKILMLTDVDGGLEDHLQELLDVAGTGLDTVFGACAGYPRGTRAPSRERREAWLREHLVDADTRYVNTIGRTVEQVRREAELHRRINAFLDDGDWQEQSAAEVRAAIQDYVNTQHDLAWAMAEPQGARGSEQLERLADLLSVPLAIAALTPLLLPTVPLWFAALLLQELRDPAPHLRPDPAHVAELAELEDHVVQNQFSAIGYRKPGPVRWLAARGILPLLDYGTRNLFGRGNLTGVRTIHFARWVLLDDDKRLLFASNYDGSLESYMDDFIDKVAWGLNLVFSNGVGYPRTHALVFGGARREQEFKDYLRRHQLPTQIWYSAYPDLTAVNIENNARIRSGLVGPLDDAVCERWLARL